MSEKNILDCIYDYLGRFVVYPNEEARIAHTLWTAGTYFPEYPDIPVFDNYPIIAFLSPDEDSGKSRALDCTQCLSYNAIDGGSYTAASLCREIDQKWPTMITMCIDELDEIFVAGKDNADYIRLLNNGYQRGKFIVRASQSKDGENVKTMAYCPKAVAGLAASKLKKTTRSRMLIIRMRPMRQSESKNIELHIDKAEAGNIVADLMSWRATVAGPLKTIDETTLSDQVNRARQIWAPLLAIAKLTSHEWFRRASNAAAFFVTKHKPEEKPSKKVFMEFYKVYLSGQYSDGIRSERLAQELQERGFPQDLDKFKIAYYLGENGYGIPIGQKREGKTVGSAYMWADCKPFFDDYLTEDEKTKLADECRGVGDSSKPLRTDTRPIAIQTFENGERVYRL